jgi:hypothetical protein
MQIYMVLDISGYAASIALTAISLSYKNTVWGGILWCGVNGTSMVYSYFVLFHRPVVRLSQDEIGIDSIRRDPYR